MTKLSTEQLDILREYDYHRREYAAHLRNMGGSYPRANYHSVQMARLRPLVDEIQQARFAAKIKAARGRKS